MPSISSSALDIGKFCLTIHLFIHLKFLHKRCFISPWEVFCANSTTGLANGDNDFSIMPAYNHSLHCFLMKDLLNSVVAKGCDHLGKAHPVSMCTGGNFVPLLKE